MLWLRFFHLLFAIAFVAGQIAGNFVSRGLRTRGEPAARFALIELMRRAFWSLQLPGLVLAGVLGNLVATRQGLRMAESAWLQQVNGLFVLTLVVLVLGAFPALRRLERAAIGASDEFERLRRRWGMWHSVIDLLYLVTLIRMVWR